jgi:hypothetical protein
MLEHCKAARIIPRAARAQKSGIARLNALDDALKRSLSGTSETSTSNANTTNPAPSQSANTELSTEEAETAERRSVELDELAVDDELRRYEAAGILAGNELDDFDILQYWQVSRSFNNH